MVLEFRALQPKHLRGVSAVVARCNGICKYG
jgi:hypothetical protein